nr:response regulator [uncultured Draconibacterium sp.]
MEESYEVLVADDSMLNTKVYMFNLKRELVGWKIHIANSPEEAIAIFSTNNISVVILDMFFGIGKLTGIEIYKEFIKIKKNFKCIAVSELSSAYGFNSGRVGIDEFLSKPVKSEDLVSAIKFQIKSLRNELKGTALETPVKLTTPGQFKLTTCAGAN